jgi:predicted DNA-binding transcriptional regulator AlpA
MDKLLTVADLAQILRRSPQTVKSDVSRRPETLPPRVRVPGGRRVLWRVQDVEQWIAQRVEK